MPNSRQRAIQPVMLGLQMLEQPAISSYSIHGRLSLHHYMQAKD